MTIVDLNNEDYYAYRQWITDLAIQTKSVVDQIGMKTIYTYLFIQKPNDKLIKACTIEHLMETIQEIMSEYKDHISEIYMVIDEVGINSNQEK